MKNKFRDLFTEKNNQQSVYLDKMLSKYNNISNKELYEVITSPVKDYKEEY